VATPETKDATMLALRGDLEQNLNLLADLGYQGAELMVRDPSQLSAGKIRKMAEGLALTIPAVSTGQILKEDGLSLSSLDEKVRASAIVRLRQVINFAAELGAQVNIGAVRGTLPAGSGREAAIAAARQSFETLLLYADKNGVVIAIEPQSRIFINWINSIQEAIDWIRTLPQQPTLLFDSYHAMLSERSISASLICAYPFLSWVHVSDSNRRTPGSGHMNLGETIRVLRALGYKGFVSVECLPQPDGARAARSAIQYLRPYIEEA
jgi:sugar phosphate isomerase/epimerase